MVFKNAISVFILLGFCFFAPLDVCGENPLFPLKISENRRYLVDHKNVPFLYNADTAWMLFLKLTSDEAGEYLANRKAKGFNVIQTQLTGFLGMTNRSGHLPFGSDHDFSKPDEPFFQHVEKVMAEAERLGLVMAIAPLWSDCCGVGWAGKEKDGSLKPLNKNGPEKSRQIGQYLGKRFGKFANVLWILGGDNDPNNAREEIRQLGLGLKETAPTQLITYHAASSHSSSDVWPLDESWLDVVMVYTYFRGFNKAWNKNQPDVYEVSHSEYAKIPVRPFFLGESTYEGEHDDWGSALQARKQAYWCLLGGGFGHAYGSQNWNVPKNWREIMELPGAASLQHLVHLFGSRPWWKLIPDIQNVVAVDGRGPVATNDLATTALAHDGSFSISYLPSKRNITIDLSRISGKKVRTWWFNPRTGESELLEEISEKKRRSFEPSQEGDWILVIDDESKGFSKPGKNNL